MTKYRKSFNFQPRDIEIIENALRSELSRQTSTALSEDESDPSRNELTVEITQLLAKIYHQKVFYSQVQKTGVPGG